MPSHLEILSGLQALEVKLRSALDETNRLKRRLAEVEKERDEAAENYKLVQNQLKEAQKKGTPPPRYFHKSDKSRKLVENYFVSADNTAELKDQIDQYIREIDRCIAHLSNTTLSWLWTRSWR